LHAIARQRYFGKNLNNAMLHDLEAEWDEQKPKDVAILELFERFWRGHIANEAE
jgi:hypothetical protein